MKKIYIILNCICFSFLLKAQDIRESGLNEYKKNLAKGILLNYISQIMDNFERVVSDQIEHNNCEHFINVSEFYKINADQYFTKATICGTNFNIKGIVDFKRFDFLSLSMGESGEEEFFRQTWQTYHNSNAIGSDSLSMLGLLLDSYLTSYYKKYATIKYYLIDNINNYTNDSIVELLKSRPETEKNSILLYNSVYRKLFLLKVNSIVKKLDIDIFLYNKNKWQKIKDIDRFVDNKILKGTRVVVNKEKRVLIEKKGN